MWILGNFCTSFACPKVGEAGIEKESEISAHRWGSHKYGSVRVKCALMRSI